MNSYPRLFVISKILKKKEKVIIVEPELVVWYHYHVTNVSFQQSVIIMMTHPNIISYFVYLLALAWFVFIIQSGMELGIVRLIKIQKFYLEIIYFEMLIS